jgi:integrase
MASVSKQPNGRWLVRYWTPDGQARKQRFDRATDARSFANKVEADKAADRFVDPRLGRIKFRDYAKEWLAAIRATIKHSTFASYEMNIRVHVNPALGNVRLQHLTADKLNAFYGTLLESGRRDGKGLSPKTVRNIHIVVRKALGDAARWGRISHNPALLADPPKARATRRIEMKTWDAGELAFFLELAQDDDLYPAWHLDAHTGLRRGELLGLQWPDLDLDAGQLAVRRTLVSVNYEIRVEEPKTPRARRTVALDAVTVKILREHRKNQLERQLSSGADYRDSDLVFCRADGSPIHPQVASDRFARIVERAGLPPISMKGLRHTHATLALKAGAPVKVVSERLGHVSTSFTMDTYAHVLPGMQEDAAAAVADLVARSRVQRAPNGPK